MSLLNNIRRAFGFVVDDDFAEEEIFRDDESSAAHQTVASNPANDKPADDAKPETESSSSDEPQSAPAPESSPSTEIESIAADALAEIVALFNSFQPEFIAKCLDPERQQTLLAQSLSPAIKERIAAVVTSEKERMERESAAERNALDADLRKMRDRNTELERRRQAFKDEQLSATRQKRALQERVHDLEEQVKKLEAEKEQFELENRSMANKLRVAGVTAGSESTEEPSAPVPDPAMEEEIAKLRQALDTHEERRKATDDLVADLRRRLAEAEAQTPDPAELNTLRDETVRLSAEIAKKDARMAEMKERLRQSEDNVKTIHRLEDENRSLRSTIESNLYDHAAQLSELRRQLEAKENKPRRGRGRPRKQRPEAQQPSESNAELTIENPANDKPSTPSTNKTTISAIDELIEGHEWLVAPTEEDLKPAPQESTDDDFGYHAPARKPQPHDDINQLTLF